LAEYSNAQILAMQRDAIRRVNEMQKISQEKLHGRQERAQPPPARGGMRRTDPPQKNGQAEEALSQQSQQEGPLQGIVQRLGLDHETLLLAAILLLLVNEGADVMLILALTYILL
jgi:hypothetical protein